MAFILNQTEAGVLVCDPDMLDVVVTSLIPRCPHLKCVIVMKTKSEEDKKVMYLMHSCTMNAYMHMYVCMYVCMEEDSCLNWGSECSETCWCKMFEITFLN